MRSHNFRGISVIQEVVCSASTLNADVKLTSLQLFRLPESSVVVSLNVLTNSCITFTEYSSCTIDLVNTHRSLVKILVHDLDPGESTAYGCTANAVTSLGNPIWENWKLTVVRERKCVASCSF
jgi:hypothetical protein